jgi:hypothetical protein
MKNFTKENSYETLYWSVTGYFLLVIILTWFISIILLMIIFPVLSFLLFIFYYDELFHTKYCYNRRLLLSILKKNPEKFKFLEYYNKLDIYYFILNHDDVAYRISYNKNEKLLSLEDNLIGYFTSVWAQEMLVNQIIFELEKIRNEKNIR